MTQDQAISIMKTGVNIYLTGSAGSGKTYVLNKYIKYLEEHDIPVAITASTGIAATHMHGMTIHGWAGIGIKEKFDEQDLDQLEEKQYLWKRFENARVLIIDEVSMLHGFRLDIVDQVCRRFRRNEKAFGGLQVILSGDFFQLPPVSKGELNPSDKIINSEAWTTLRPAICYLTEQHRQEDPLFTNILNSIRQNNLTEEHFQNIEGRLNNSLESDIIPTKLYTHNLDVDAINEMELLKLPGDFRKYNMTAKGPDTLVDILKKSCLASGDLCLKESTEVMFIKNNFEEGYVNGTRGKVVGFLPDNTPTVRLQNGRLVNVGPMEWAIEENNNKKASIFQLPLRLAWAITIHKSQGMSLDNAEIDLSKTFVYGMGYVALSRVRTLAGVKLVGFKRESLQVDPLVLEFDQNLQKESLENEKLFGQLKKEAQEKLEHEFIVRSGGSLEAIKKSKSDSKKPTILITKELLEEGKKIDEIVKIRDYTWGTIVNHVELILDKYPETKIDHIRPSETEIKLVEKYFTKAGGRLSPLKSALAKDGHDLSFDQIRLARLFVKN